MRGSVSPLAIAQPAALRSTCRGVPRARDGGRWTLDYRVHYEWCLGARFREAQAEREARHDYIESFSRH